MEPVARPQLPSSTSRSRPSTAPPSGRRSPQPASAERGIREECGVRNSAVTRGAARAAAARAAVVRHRRAEAAPRRRRAARRRSSPRSRRTSTSSRRSRSRRRAWRCAAARSRRCASCARRQCPSAACRSSASTRSPPCSTRGCRGSACSTCAARRRPPATAARAAARPAAAGARRAAKLNGPRAGHRSRATPRSTSSPRCRRWRRRVLAARGSKVRRVRLSRQLLGSVLRLWPKHAEVIDGRFEAHQLGDPGASLVASLLRNAPPSARLRPSRPLAKPPDRTGDSSCSHGGRRGGRPPRARSEAPPPQRPSPRRHRRPA